MNPQEIKVVTEKEERSEKHSAQKVRNIGM